MATLIIDGSEYAFDMDFDVGEARIIYRFSKVTIDKLHEHGTNPNVVAAFLFIAFKRKWPDVPDDELEQRVNKVKLAKIDMREEEVDVLPPAQTPSAPAESARTSGASFGSGAEPSPESVSPATSGHPA